MAPAVEREVKQDKQDELTVKWFEVDLNKGTPFSPEDFIALARQEGISRKDSGCRRMAYLVTEGVIRFFDYFQDHDQALAVFEKALIKGKVNSAGFVELFDNPSEGKIGLIYGDVERLERSGHLPTEESNNYQGEVIKKALGDHFEFELKTR